GLRHHLAGGADGPGEPLWPARGQPPSPAVPVDVLAFPRRRMDRPLHLRLPDGSAAMSQPHDAQHLSAHGDDEHGGEHHAHDEGSHGSLRDYVIGFILSVILTAIPFWLVMGEVIPDSGTTALVILGFAVVQIVVQ